MNNETDSVVNGDTPFNELKTMIVKEFGPDAADDDRISRFLRAREFDVKQGHAMLKKNLEWREKHSINTILQDYNDSELYTKYFPDNLIGSDKEGSPLLLVNFGKIDFKGFMKAATLTENLRHFVHNLELSEEKMREDSQVIHREAYSDGTLACYSDGRGSCLPL